MGKRGLVDFQLLLCWIGATDHINHGVVRLWCPIGVPIAQVIQYEHQIKKAANNMAAFCYCILEYSSRASFRRRSIKAAKSSTWTMRGDFWDSPTRRVGNGSSPVLALFSAVLGFIPKYFSAIPLSGISVVSNSANSKKLVFSPPPFMLVG